MDKNKNVGRVMIARPTWRELGWLPPLKEERTATLIPKPLHDKIVEEACADRREKEQG